jgi:predicted dehydrogenase
VRFLVVGLGSMGKRRIRCLRSLEITNQSIAGFDVRADRREEVRTNYGVRCFDSFASALAEFQPSALIISVPPDAHHLYIKMAIDNRIHFFVEASVVDTLLRESIAALNESCIVAAPSATMLFHPAIRLIERIVKSGELGKLSNIILHSGQFLPDWHSNEQVSEYYVSNRSTGGCREIVPFELSWFTRVFGWPRMVAGNYRKTIDIPGAEYIDDTYNLLLDYSNYLAIVSVDVVSRYATRRLVINGSAKQLVWSWDENSVRVYDPAKSEWDTREYQMAKAEKGYNSNIGENMYIDETRCFIEAISGLNPFINSLENDMAVLNLLYKAEQSDMTSAFILV